MKVENQHWPSATDVHPSLIGTTDYEPQHEEWKQISLREAVARGEILRTQKPRTSRKEKEYEVIGLEFIKRPPLRKHRDQTSRYASSNHNHKNVRPKNRRKSRGSCDLTTCKNYKRSLTCSMRIEELAVPRKRACLETWRENYNILPEIMINRLREHVLDQRPVFKVDDAIRCFRGKQKKNKSSKNKSSERRNQPIKSVSDMDELKCLCAKFASTISKRLIVPLKIRLDHEQRNIAHIVAYDIKQLMKSRKKGSQFSDLGYKKILLEVSNMVAVWIDTILVESSNKYWIDALRDLDEEEGPALDIIDSIMDEIGKSDDELLSPSKSSTDGDNNNMDDEEGMILVKLDTDLIVDESKDVKKEVTKEIATAVVNEEDKSEIDNINDFIEEEVAKLIEAVTELLDKSPVEENSEGSEDDILDEGRQEESKENAELPIKNETFVDAHDTINTEGDESKKVTFDALGADLLTGRKIKHVSTDHLNPPNYGLLSDADESWPDLFVPANLDTVKKSVTSLGNIKEDSDKIPPLEVESDEPELDKSKKENYADELDVGPSKYESKTSETRINVQETKSETGEDMFNKSRQSTEEVKEKEEESKSKQSTEEENYPAEEDIIAETKKYDFNLESENKSRQSTEKVKQEKIEENMLTQTKNYYVSQESEKVPEKSSEDEENYHTGENIFLETKKYHSNLENENESRQSTGQVNDQTEDILAETRNEDVTKESDTIKQSTQEKNLKKEEEMFTETQNDIVNREITSKSRQSGAEVNDHAGEDMFAGTKNEAANIGRDTIEQSTEEETFQTEEDMFTESKNYDVNQVSENRSRQSIVEVNYQTPSIADEIDSITQATSESKSSLKFTELTSTTSDGKLETDQEFEEQKPAEKTSQDKSVSEVIEEMTTPNADDHFESAPTTETTEKPTTYVIYESGEKQEIESRPHIEVNYDELTEVNSRETLDTQLLAPLELSVTKTDGKLEVASATKITIDQKVSGASVDMEPALNAEEVKGEQPDVDKSNSAEEQKAQKTEHKKLANNSASDKAEKKKSDAKETKQLGKLSKPVKKPDIKTKPKAKPNKIPISKSPARAAPKVMPKPNEQQKGKTIPPKVMPEIKAVQVLPLAAIEEAPDAQPDFEYKVCLETAPSWVFNQGKGEPSEDSLVTQLKMKERKTLTERMLRQWCRDLQVTATNLEHWSRWIDDASANIIHLKRNKIPHRAAAQQKLWMDLKTSIDKDTVLWSKLFQRAVRKLGKYNSMLKDKVELANAKVLCPCKM